jgi:hypothetical protein
MARSWIPSKLKRPVTGRSAEIRSVSAGFARWQVAPLGLGALERLGKTPAGDQRFDTSDQDEVRVALAVLTGFDLAAELTDVGERLKRGRRRTPVTRRRNCVVVRMG